LLRHSGAYVFCQENQDHLLKTIGQMAIENLTNRGVKLVDSEGKEITNLTS